MDVCGPCKFRNQENKAVKYCLTCEESQCKLCAEIHLSSKATKKHLLLAITDLSKALKTYEDLETYQNCKDHAEKRLEYFCLDHEHFLCSTCLLNIKDLACKSIAEVDTAGQQLVATKFNERISDDLQNVAKYCKERENEIQNMLDKTLSNKKEITKYLEEIKHQFINRFEKWEKDILETVDASAKKQESELESQQNYIKETRQTASENYDILQKIVNHNSAADIFRCTLSLMEQLEKLSVSNMLKSMDIQQHSVDLSPILYSLLKSDESYPLMKCKTTKDIQTASTSFDLTENKGSFINETKKVAHTRERNVSNDYTCSSSDADIDCSVRDLKDVNQSQKTETSNKNDSQKYVSSNEVANEGTDSFFVHLSDCVVTIPDGKQPKVVDIVTLPDSCIVLSDSKGSRLLRLNANLTFKDIAELSHPPGSMTVLNEKFLVVCLPSGYRVAFISLSPEFKWMRNFKTLRVPKCVHTIDSTRLLVSMKDDCDGLWYIQILSTDGALRWDIGGNRRVIRDANLISSIKLISTSPRYYLQCCTVSDALFCYDVNGKEQFEFKVKSPRYLFVDKLHKIYILDSCGQLQILTNSGKLLHTVRVPSEINCLTCSLKGDTFILVNQSSVTISVYRVQNRGSIKT